MPNPNWTREYPKQEEILDYLVDVAHKYGLYRHIRFNSAVEEARWDNSSNKWVTNINRLGAKEAEITQTYTITSDFLVSAVGQLSIPKYPDIQGLKSFQGKIMHSARWDWNYDLKGKKIGIIGTGATAAQIIPEIASESQKLVVFQRTPAWVMPRHDEEIGSMRQFLYKYAPPIRKRYRSQLMDVRESVVEVILQPESPKYDVVTGVSRKHMLDALPGKRNESLRESLRPDYPFSCKRIIVSDDYYPAMALPNVVLETDSIAEINHEGVTMADDTNTHHDLDVIILATGFRSTQFMFPIKVYGMHGHSLEEAWSRTGATAYLGITVENIPNFGMAYGPGTNLAHNSLILQIEAQSLYINTLIAAVLAAKKRGQTLRLLPKPDVVRDYNVDLQSRLARSTFAHPACTSWFKDEHGRIVNNWAGSAVDYQKRVSFVDWHDFLVQGSGKHLVEAIPGGVTRWKRRVEETTYSDRALLGMAMGIVASCATMLWSLRQYYPAVPVLAG